MTVPPGYTDRDVERWVAEPPKDPRRGAFARDRARVVHSSALRRLGAKTQVVGPGTDDFVRTRLTHSLEVAQVGRELGQVLGCDPDVVETACLAHDLGHPPFGHNGETALDEAAAHIGGFEGNAQTLRLLTRLEPKILDPRTGRPAGLNLTRAVLDACAKYPWPRDLGPDGSDPEATGSEPTGRGKFGVYGEDAAVFTWMRAGAPTRRRCVEAQVMDLADDIAYCVHDVEDAVVGGAVDPRRLADPGQVRRVEEQARSWYAADLAGAGAQDGDVVAALRRLRDLPCWVGAFDGTSRALAALKNLASQLIGRFTTAVEEATRAQYHPGKLTRYGADIVVPGPVRLEIVALKAVAALWVMAAEEHRPVYEHQRQIIGDLVDVLARKAPDVLDRVYAEAWRAATDDAARLRVIIDQVAALTDLRAVRWHRDLC